MKNIFKMLAMTVILGLMVVGCSGGDKAPAEGTKTEAKKEEKKDEKSEAKSEEKKDDKKAEPAKAASGEIAVVSREEGSGTRGAFVEITKVEEKGDDGKKVDNTVKTAQIQNGTGNVINFVKADAKAIGYISLGSVKKDVIKALKVDGVEANEENVKSGKYPIQRPFLFVFKAEAELTPAAKDFLAFCLSKEGQEIVAAEKYVVVDDKAPAYEKAADAKGKVALTGSTSVKPVAEKLIEAYKKANPDVEVSIPAATGSGAGIEEAAAGKNDIGMSSRDLKAEEKLEKKAIAMDGIAVIVSPENPVEEISMENIKNIFTGKITNWEDVK